MHISRSKEINLHHHMHIFKRTHSTHRKSINRFFFSARLLLTAFLVYSVFVLWREEKIARGGKPLCDGKKARRGTCDWRRQKNHFFFVPLIRVSAEASLSSVEANKIAMTMSMRGDNEMLILNTSPVFNSNVFAIAGFMYCHISTTVNNRRFH